MKHIKKPSFIILIILVALLVSGCSITFDTSDSQSRTDGGVFKSINRGGQWRQLSLIATISGKPQSFVQTNVVAITSDPQDNKAVYAGTEGGGMLYSYDGAASWTLARSLGQRTVNDIVVSPDDKCTIYAASENKIYKSDDCSRSWTEIYFDNDLKVRINSLAINPREAKVVYAGTSRGEVIVSSDYGKSWATVKRFEDSGRSTGNVVIKVIVNSKNTNNLWVATSGSGVYKSDNAGTSWLSFKEEFMEIHTKNALKASDLALAASNGKTVVVATEAGLVRTYDSGAHWHVVDLIPPADKTAINVVAIHSSDADIIYYVTNTSFGWTDDGGKNWTSKKLPSTRTGVALAVDPDNPDVVYLGVKLVEKK